MLKNVRKKIKQFTATFLSLAMLTGPYAGASPVYAQQNVIKAEAEDAIPVSEQGTELSAEEIFASDNNASGGQVAGQFHDGEGRGLVWENVTETKKSTLKIAYAAGSGSYGYFDIYINDATEPYRLPFYNCGSWMMSERNIVGGNIEIPAGATLRIVPSRAANIDYITLSDDEKMPTIPTQSSIVRIEAESGYIVNPATNERIDHSPNSSSEASGGAYYGYLDNKERGIVFENVTDSPKTGILVRYTSNNANNVIYVSVNDSDVMHKLTFTNTGGWSFQDNARYAYGCMDIPAGAKLMITPGVGCDIDYIELNDSTCETKLPTEKWRTLTTLARELETESIVLAQNDDSLLPLDKNETVAVFGRGQLAPTTGGNGSGAVNGSYTSTFIDGLNALGITPYQELLNYYQERVHSRTDIDHGWNQSTEYPGEWGTQVWSGTTWSQSPGVNIPDVKLDNGQVTDDGLVARAAQNADKAIVFITRTTGSEEMDRILQPGDWYLDPSEKVLLEQVTDKFEDVVVILSVNGSIDMTWVKEYDIDAVMISYGAGSQNGYALADLVFGIENPSGKLADTITETYEEHPTADTFGYVTYDDLGLVGSLNNTRFGSNDPVSTYLEGIYMGYRYFDTFGKDVLYPFGSGLSYSDFEFKDMSVNFDSENKAVTVAATIENVTADKTIVPGKEVMEVYLSAPQGNLEQPYQKLLDFDKTEELAAGESETISISIPLDECASYSEEKAAYILEPGYYYLRVGSSSRNASVAGAFYVEEEILVEQLENRLTMSDNAEEYFEEEALTNKEVNPISYQGEAEEMETARENAVVVKASDVETSAIAPEEVIVDFPEIGDDEPVYQWSDVESGRISLEKFAAQLTVDEMIMMLSGNVWFGLEKVRYTDDTSVEFDFSTKNGGITGAGITRSVERLGIPSIVFADGSAGIAFDGNIGWTRAGAVACVWNKELIRDFAVQMGRDMLSINCDVWLAPSINLHRNPLNGRNNEYYSEDPILSGLLAGIVADGVAESGVTVCLKHYAGNDQEYYRRGHLNNTTVANGTSKDAINVIATERALREIILKPFEIAIKTGKVKNVMSAFNKINGEYAASSHNLLTKILRDEWKYDGFVVTDWGELDTIAHGGEMMAAGNTVIMRGDHQMWDFTDHIRESLTDGTLTEHQLRTNAYYLLNTIHSSALSSMPGKHQYRDTLTILSTSLPDAKSNDEYSKVKVNPLVAAGGDGDRFEFSISENTQDQLPDGLVLHANGSISGKVAPGQEGGYQITFKVTDNLGNSAEKALSLNVVGELSFTPDNLMTVVSNTPYSQQITALDIEGQPVEAVFTVEGNLPAGISLSEDGLLSGTCTDIGSGQFEFTVSARTANGEKRGECNYVLYTIEESVQINTTTIANAEPGNGYTQTLEASHGWGSYTWDVDGLPEGFILDGNQIVYGYYSEGNLYKKAVPETLTGIYEIRVTVKDEMDASDTKTVTLQIGTPDESFAFTTGGLSDGKAGRLYEDVTFTTQNGVGNVVYTISENGDGLPQGMLLSADGVLSGTPAYTSAGEYNIVIKATDEDGNICEKSYYLYVEGGLSANPEPHSVFVINEGESFDKQFAATGGIMQEKKYELHESSDELPAGLTFTANNSTMTISGTPQEGTAGTYHLVFLMDDASFSGNPVTSIVPYTLIIKQNVALNKTASASSYSTSDVPPLAPENTVDGDDTTRWSSHWAAGDVNEAWLKVDLGDTYHLDEVNILWETAVSSDYKLLVSDDDVNYTEVTVIDSNRDSLRHIWQIEASGRYIMMQSVSAATQWGSSIYEFEAYGTPIVEEEPEKPELPFTDVSESDWFYSSVYDVYIKNLMTGETQTTFGSNKNVIRADFVTVLWRMEGSPEVSYTNKFADVPENLYYTDAILWAEQNGIVSGYTENTFGTNKDISREQIVTILYRYAVFKGYNVSNQMDLAEFTDAESVSSYAIDAMKWCVAEGIMAGSNGKLNPQGNALRAEMAAFINRFTIKMNK